MYRIKQIPEDFIVVEKRNLKLSRDGKYFYFKLKKRDMTTEECMQEICRISKVSRNKVSYSGFKDKRAVTEQFFSSLLPMKNISKEKFSTEFIGKGKIPISIGSHYANYFGITVRNLDKGDLEVFGNNIKGIRKNSRFLNLFDEQRFSAGNDKVGECMIKGDFRNAAMLVIGSKGESGRTVKRHLEKNPNDYVGALRLIPKKIAVFYIHSLQSRLWNEIAEKLSKNKRNIEVPIIGFGTEFKSSKVRQEYERIMEKRGIGLRSFVISKFPEISSEGSYRDLFVKLSDLKIEKIHDDELNRNMRKVVLKFSLPKGSYATIAVKGLFSQSKKALP